MTAKEMFKELGYSCSNLLKDWGKIIYIKHQKSRIESSHYLEKKSFTFKGGKVMKKIFHEYYEYNDENVSVTNEENKAIHQQMKELNWI